jgi:hypothetical protein
MHGLGYSSFGIFIVQCFDTALSRAFGLGDGTWAWDTASGHCGQSMFLQIPKTVDIETILFKVKTCTSRIAQDVSGSSSTTQGKLYPTPRFIGVIDKLRARSRSTFRHRQHQNKHNNFATTTHHKQIALPSHSLHGNTRTYHKPASSQRAPKPHIPGTNPRASRSPSTTPPQWTLSTEKSSSNPPSTSPT